MNWIEFSVSMFISTMIRYVFILTHKIHTIFTYMLNITSLKFETNRWNVCSHIIDEQITTADLCRSVNVAMRH